ncbi:hypothetical protein BCR39DRAFT_174618 [Naematelia encephala]|uniref:HMG box domain-containing protein n=1 Tax=Naematelia encephala TaxID=71784 RepID=A0A1Y2B5G4_9TREE|nr:hypothetical protein BCR39DRAFT_174618 [Naematelia encephala]
MTTGSTTRQAARALKIEGLPPPRIVNMSQPLTPSPTNHISLVRIPSPTPPYSSPDEVVNPRPPIMTHHSMPVVVQTPPSTFSPRHMPPSSPAFPTPTFHSPLSPHPSPIRPHSFSSDTYFSPILESKHSHSPPWQTEQDPDDNELESKFTDMATSSPVKGSPLKPTHTPRPPNAWILYRSDKLRAIAAGETLPGMHAVLAEMGLSSSSAGSDDSNGEETINKRSKKAKGKKGAKEPTEGMLALGKGKAGRGLPQADISKMISLLWKRESAEVRGTYERLSETEKAEHQRKYPGYKFQPLRKAEKIKLREEREREKEAVRREKEIMRSGGRSQRARTRTRLSPSSPYSVLPPGSMTRPPPAVARSLSFSGVPEGQTLANQSVFWAGVGGTTFPHKTNDVPPAVGSGDQPQRAYPFPIPPGALPSMSAEDHASNPFSDETWSQPMSVQSSANDRMQQQSESQRPPKSTYNPNQASSSASNSRSIQAQQSMYGSLPMSSYMASSSGYQPTIAHGYYPVVPFIYETIPLSPGQLEADIPSSNAGSPNKIASEWLSEQTGVTSDELDTSETPTQPQASSQPQSFPLQHYIPAEMLQHYQMPIPQPMWMYDPSQPPPASGTAGFVTLFNPHNGDLRVLEYEGNEAGSSNPGYSVGGLQGYETLQVQMTEDNGPFLSTQALSPDSWSGNTPTTSAFPRNGTSNPSTSTAHPPRHVSQSAYPTQTDDPASVWMPSDRTFSFSNLMGMGGYEMGGPLPTLNGDELLNWEAGEGVSSATTTSASATTPASSNPITPMTGTETKSSVPSMRPGGKRGRAVGRKWDS